MNLNTHAKNEKERELGDEERKRVWDRKILTNR